MRFFFRSKQFKIICALAAALLLSAVLIFWGGKRLSPGSDLLGTVASPFQRAAETVYNGVSRLFSVYRDGDKILLKNEELEKELNTMREKLADYESTASQNSFYEKYLGIKDEHPDFSFQPGNVIARDPNDRFRGFTVSAGSRDGVRKYDPVLTDAGLVGYVESVGLTTCKVTTLLSPGLSAGALDNRTRDSGIITGSGDLAEKGLFRFNNLAESCTVAVGDYVITSGEGIFPEGLLVGEVGYIGTDSSNNSLYAEVKPFAPPESLKSVMIITSFKGQIGEEKEP